MTPAEIREARQSLGLTAEQMARLMETTAGAVYRWEMAGDQSSARSLPARAERLLQAYLAGYRPDDWPT